MFSKALQLVETFVASRDTSAAVVYIGHQGREYGPYAYGNLSFFPNPQPTQADSIFDLASLSKVIGTTTIALHLMEEGVFSLQDTLGKLLPHVPQDKKNITIAQILSHTSGLPAVFPLYQDPLFRQKETALETILNVPMSNPIGSKVEYSCIGFITLGFLIEYLTKSSLDILFRTILSDPLGLKDTEYCPAKTKLERIAFTEWDPEEKQFIRGQVHDENARSLRGISGNAGLFGTARDLGIFAQMLLQGGSFGGRQILKTSTIELFQNNYTNDSKEPRTLGWLLPSPEWDNGYSLLSPHSIGHTGFTGTSLWIDFTRQFYGILLTNRVHPTRLNTNLISFRPRFYGALCQAMNEIS